ncbi:Ribosome-binding protein 1 [Babesia ovata]|uniref:Ribosome-binding protein 1 n=1 Tax=Babesia ovata TaxID=189622 RepID=A0A2H6K836_9APIC|nr:Ribosome-binding protein 1 [Babesia ovata]GBE59154.1 Ribosome-binding protein 1 [Babesia ovata]
MMVESGNRFFFTTLRDCFVFFDWLYTEPEGRKTHEDVAKKLYGLLKDYYDGSELTEGKIQSNLTNFLSKVDTFYKKLVAQHVPQEALGTAASIKKDATPEEIVNALLECLPKFLAAIYYLWYCVSHTFESLGGGGWKDDCPGWEKGRWYGLRNNWGGDLQAYLRSSDTNEYRVIPGSFNKDEVRDGWSYNGYSRGYSMVTSLKNIFGKRDDAEENVFRDVFATSVLAATSGTQISNTANALALVNVFCEIVVEADKNVNREKFKTHVQSKGGCIHWDFLKDHCSTLKSQLGKLFNEKAFSFTGYGGKRQYFQTTAFVRRTAQWLRENLDEVRKNLEKIQQFESEHDGNANEFARLSKHHDMLQAYYAELGPHFTKNLFPYGFTFYGGKEHIKTNAPYELLRAEWDSIIFDLRRANGGLAELKRILDGKGCAAPPPKPRPRPAPAPRPPRPARPVPPPPGTSRTTGGRTTGPRLLGDWSYVGSRASGVGGGNAGGRGTNHRGGGSGASRGSGGAPGAPRNGIHHSGSRGAKSAQRGRHPGRTMSTKPQRAQSQNDSQRHSQQHPPPAASSASRISSPPAATLPTPARIVSQPPAHGHSSASSSSSSSSSVNGTGGQERGPQVPASGHVQQNVQTSMGSTVTLPHASPVLEPGKQCGASQDSMQPRSSDPLNSASRYSGGVTSTQHSPKGTSTPGENTDARMGIVVQPSHILPSSPGAGERVGPGGAPSTGGSLTVDSTDGVLTASEPVASLSVITAHDQSAPRQDSLSHGAGDPGHGGSSMPHAGSSHDGAPGAVGTLVDQVPDSDGKLSSGIRPAVSSKTAHTQTSIVQTPDSLPPVVPPPGGGQGLDGQAPSSNLTQQHPQGSQQNLTSGETITAATNRAGPGGDEASGGGGGSARGTDGDSQVGSHSGQPSNTSQHSVQHHTSSHSPRDSASDIADSPGDRGLALQSPPLINPQGDTGDASGHSPASIPQAPISDPLSDPDNAVTRGQQIVPTRDNGPLGQPGPTLSVPPPPPSAPPPSIAADPSTPPSTPHGSMGAQGVHGQQAMQTPDPNLIGDTDHTEPLNQQVTSSSVDLHDPPGKSRSGSPHLTPGTPTISQHDAVHGAVLIQPSSVSGPQPSSIAASPAGGGQDPDDEASLLDPNLPDATLSMAIPGALPMTFPVLQPGQESGGAAGSGSPGVTIGGPNSLNGQTFNNNLGSSGASMNSGSDASHQIPPQTPMLDPNQFQLEIEKLYTPDMIYGADTFQGEPLSAVGHKRVVSLSDTYSNIPTQAPFREKFHPKFTTLEFEDKCVPPWIAKRHNDNLHEFPETELFPSESPHTVREMLIWMVGLQNPKHHVAMEKCIKKAFDSMPDATLGEVKLSVNGAEITAKQVLDALKPTAMFSSSVLSTIEPNWKGNITLSATLKPKVSDQSQDPDPACLLCQLRDYAYACCHQLAFLKSQCSRDQLNGGWQDCYYGRDVSSPKSPLQAFLTDASASKFETYPFDPCNICLKSRVNMGFNTEDLSASQQTGNTLHTILSPICGGNDPLLTLSSYLTCLTRRTPRTTGEIVSFFHNFGNSLYLPSSQMSPLGSALSEPHRHCPDWDILAADDLNALQDLRGSAPPSSIHHDKDNDHPSTLSTLLGCGIDNFKCRQLMKPITYRAYALLWESLKRLQKEMKNLQCHDSKALHQCANALPLLYLHGFTPPESTLKPSLKCSELIAKLEEVANGKPIARLMTAMGNFLIGICAPFLFAIVALWLIATLYIAHSLLYRMDVLRIRSHLMRSKASHLIDVKSLLTHGRKMLSLYKDVDYFDDEPVDQFDVTQ